MTRRQQGKSILGRKNNKGHILRMEIGPGKKGKGVRNKEVRWAWPCDSDEFALILSLQGTIRKLYGAKHELINW